MNWIEYDEVTISVSDNSACFELLIIIYFYTPILIERVILTGYEFPVFFVQLQTLKRLDYYGAKIKNSCANKSQKKGKCTQTDIARMQSNDRPIKKTTDIKEIQEPKLLDKYSI